MLRKKNGEVITLLLLILIIWAGWKFICKPIYNWLFTKKPAVERVQPKKSKKDDLNTWTGKLKHPIKYTQSLMNSEEREQIADEQTENCKNLLDNKDFSNALVKCEEALETTNKNGKIATIHQLKGKIYQATGKYGPARKEFAIASEKSDSAQQKQTNAQLFADADNLFADSFLKQNYNHRKLLLPVENMEDIIPSNYISAFKVNNMPNVQMPIGHPVPNQLYIAHPYIPNKYVPFEDYEMDFLGERVREFCEFAQALGASEVRIESIQTKSNEQSASQKKQKGGKVSSEAVATVTGGTVPLGGNFDKSNENTQYLLDVALQGISISQKFTPTQPPFLPTNLVWYNHEPSWQQLYRQRMRGGLEEHREKIESKKSRVVQNSEMARINAEMEAIISMGGFSSNTSSEQKLDTKDDTEMTIYVKFAPLNKLQEK